MAENWPPLLYFINLVMAPLGSQGSRQQGDTENLSSLSDSAPTDSSSIGGPRLPGGGGAGGEGDVISTPSLEPGWRHPLACLRLEVGWGAVQVLGGKARNHRGARQ